MTAITNLNIGNFLNTGFKEFSIYDCKINIPSMIDGFKISQRKVMHTMLARNKKMKVEQFANDASGYTAYHHGSANLEGVIVGMAQDFAGTNNVNFLTPCGQFGNILDHSAAAGRYIFVEPNANFRKWFLKSDDCIVQYEEEDGEKIEPTYFIPLVPTLLFNGSAGIGTGYAARIFSYKPEDVLNNVKLALAGKKLKVMVPHSNGYVGLVEKNDNQVVYTGVFERVNSTTLRITALPLGYDLNDYKAELIKLIDKGDVRDFDDHSSDTNWDIVVYASREFVKQDDEVLLNKLKLVTRDSENITVWDDRNRIRHFNTPEELIEYFVQWRLTAYEARRLKQIDLLIAAYELADEKIRFIRYYIKNAKWFSDNTKVSIVAAMEKEKFTHIDELLSIRVYNLTLEQIQKLEEDVKSLKNSIQQLKKTTANEMYVEDLAAVKNK